MIEKTFKSVFACGLLAAASFSAQGYEAGDWILRGGAATVDPNEDSGVITPSPVPGAQGEVGLDSDTQLGLTVAYMITDNIGVELLAATPFTHTVTLEGDLKGSGSLAEVTHLPPTISAQYYFDTNSIATPYLGAGINYTIMLESEITSNGAGVLDGLGISDHSVDVDDSVGLSLQAGVDVELSEKWLFNAAVWYMDIDTTAKVANAVEVDLEIDPWVYMVGVGYKF